MNSQSGVVDTQDANQTTRITTLLETLRSKVKSFTVLDRQGELIGVVKDLILDANRQLNLVVSKDGQGLSLLLSKLIKKIDRQNRYVLIDMDKSELENMPEYLEPETPGNREFNNYTNNNLAEQVGEEEIIRLLGERLIVNSTKRKIGEVVVRKIIETRMVTIPVRREKLIIEQISPENKQLAEIDLGEEEISGLELTEHEAAQLSNFEHGLTVSGEFDSPKIASLLLNAIALEKKHGCQKVRIAIVVEDEEHQQKYQEWFNRCSKGEQPKSE